MMKKKLLRKLQLKIKQKKLKRPLLKILLLKLRKKLQKRKPLNELNSIDEVENE